MKRPDLLGHEVVVDDRVSFFVQSNMGATSTSFTSSGRRSSSGSRPRCGSSRTPGWPRCAPGGLEEGRGPLGLRHHVARSPAAGPRSGQPGRVGPRPARQRRPGGLGPLGRAARQGVRRPGLAEAARELDGEAIRIEAERPSARPADWLALAQRARTRGIPEPVPSALAHRAFRARSPASRPRRSGRTSRNASPRSSRAPRSLPLPPGTPTWQSGSFPTPTIPPAPTARPPNRPARRSTTGSGPTSRRRSWNAWPRTSRPGPSRSPSRRRLSSPIGRRLRSSCWKTA